MKRIRLNLLCPPSLKQKQFHRSYCKTIRVHTFDASSTVWIRIHYYLDLILFDINRAIALENLEK